MPILSSAHRPSAWKRTVVFFLLSQNISLFGSSVVSYAILWHITLETSSGLWMMLSTLCSLVPQVLISPFGGVWADRYSRKKMIMLADGFIALATLGLALSFLAGYRSLSLLLVASVIRSIGGGIQGPAVSAIYPQLVPGEQLTRVQGISQTLGSVMLLLSPAVGGLILGTVGIVGAFFVDVVTAALAIVVFAFIKMGPVSRSTAPLSVRDDLLAGLRYTFGHSHLRRLVVVYAFSFFLFTPASILTPLLVERTFGGDVALLTANEMVWTIGTLLGGLFVAMKGAFKERERTAALCLTIFGVLFALLGVAGSFPIYLILMGLAGVFMPVVGTVLTVHIQQLTTPEMMGRVFSLVQIIAASSMPLAILLFGPLADVVPVQWLLIASGALLALVGQLYRWVVSRP